MDSRELFKLAYGYVRLREYENATYEQWDYAHSPSGEELYRADLLWHIVQDCHRQLDELRPFVEGTTELERAYSCYVHSRNSVPLPKLAHLANCFGIAPFSHMPWRIDKRDWYIGHYDWHLESAHMGSRWNHNRRAEFLRAARELFGL